MQLYAFLFVGYILALKYYFNASHKTDDSLICQTLKVSKNLYQTDSWYTGVNTILKELNLNETNCDQAKFTLIIMYKTFWRNKLENEAVFKKGKLRTSYSFKLVFQREIYLDFVRDRSHQQALMKLRISAHKLEIENGIYSKKSITDRLCKKMFSEYGRRRNSFHL